MTGPATTSHAPVDTATKRDAIRRLAYVEGHLHAIRRMIENDRQCLDVLDQTYAVRKAIEKLDERLLEHHLRACLIHGLREGNEEAVIGELLDLYDLAGR